MTKGLSQLSSFVRVGPIPSLKLSGQLLKLEDRCSLNQSLCALLLEPEKMLQNPITKAGFGEKNISTSLFLTIAPKLILTLFLLMNFF